MISQFHKEYTFDEYFGYRMSEVGHMVSKWIIEYHNFIKKVPLGSILAMAYYKLIIGYHNRDTKCYKFIKNIHL